MSHGCPVLHELEHAEDYNAEHENPPVLSGGDYDVGGIRSCAEECAMAAQNRALTASRDEWRDRAAANAARIEEVTRNAAGLHLALIRIVNGDATVDGMKAIANAALDQP